MTRSTKQRPVLGPVLEGWTPPPTPRGDTLAGRYVELVELDAEKHASSLCGACVGHDQLWDYMPYGPFASSDAYRQWAQKAAGQDDPFFYAIRPLVSDASQGVASYLRIAPPSGSIEVGHINLSPALQGTTAATEAMYLMMRWAFEAGYRRYEWKCDALNLPSRRAAQRLGLSYEGIFRQATVVKGRNRDTACFAAIDSEWPDLARAFETWLAPGNFIDGRQRISLRELTGPILVARDPALRSPSFASDVPAGGA